MSITITLLFVFTLVFVAQVAETQAQMHMDDDHMGDYPWDDDGHMDDYPWDDDDQTNDYPCDDDYTADSPWDDDHMDDFPWGDDPMAGFPLIDDNQMMGPPYLMPVVFWMYIWMLYMTLFMGPGF
jgi:hypothetical protein